MKVVLQRSDGVVHFTGTNESGCKVDIDGPTSIGGTNSGVRPMELVLFALASCSAMDVVEIIRKQRMRLDDLRIEVEGTRSEDRVPAVYTSIHLRYIFRGDIRLSALEQAVELALHKYCSVEAMLKPTVAITHEITIDSTVKADG